MCDNFNTCRLRLCGTTSWVTSSPSLFPLLNNTRCLHRNSPLSSFSAAIQAFFSDRSLFCSTWKLWSSASTACSGVSWLPYCRACSLFWLHVSLGLSLPPLNIDSSNWKVLRSVSVTPELSERSRSSCSVNVSRLPLVLVWISCTVGVTDVWSWGLVCSTRRASKASCISVSNNGRSTHRSSSSLRCAFIAALVQKVVSPTCSLILTAGWVVTCPLNDSMSTTSSVGSAFLV